MRRLYLFFEGQNFRSHHSIGAGLAQFILTWLGDRLIRVVGILILITFCFSRFSGLGFFILTA